MTFICIKLYFGAGKLGLANYLHSLLTKDTILISYSALIVDMNVPNSYEIILLTIQVMDMYEVVFWQHVRVGKLSSLSV